MHYRLIHSLAFFCSALAAACRNNDRWQPQFPTDAYERQLRGPRSAVRNRTSGNAPLDLTRRDGPAARNFKETNATVPVALGLWVGTSVATCFGWTRVAP